MEHRKRFAPIVVLLLLLVGGYYLYSTGNLPFFSSADASANIASGFIEGEHVAIAVEVGGRVDMLTAGEGDNVKAGQELVRLDRSLLDAQIAQAQAAADTAKAQLAQIKNGARPSDVSAARAALAAAQENYDKLRAGATTSDLTAAQAALAAAQQNYEKVRAGLTIDQLTQLKAQVDNAQAALDASQAAYDRIGGASNPFIGSTPQSVALQQATNTYKAAVAAFSDARSHPTASELALAKSQVDQAQAALARLTPDAAQLAAARAQVEQAQAALERLTPTVDSIAVAENQVKQAEAAVAVLKTQVTKMAVKSPVEGVIARRAVNVGEIAAPGATLLTVSKTDPVKLTIYVPETRLGEIKIGEQVGVQVDSFPGKTFTGKIVFIASQAEFTPRNVQTKAERVNTVFAVKLEIPNPDAALKPGMPADALLR
ncbi:MAG: efflux RND transporter periplasmic adaptor subunit [Chloroflexi bacterium]|nr:efflux RND transporter periplasmic adaptor subunit [Chloroflexota bacterium]